MTPVSSPLNSIHFMIHNYETFMFETNMFQDNFSDKKHFGYKLETGVL